MVVQIQVSRVPIYRHNMCILNNLKKTELSITKKHYYFFTHFFDSRSFSIPTQSDSHWNNIVRVVYLVPTFKNIKSK